MPIPYSHHAVFSGLTVHDDAIGHSSFTHACCIYRRLLVLLLRFGSSFSVVASLGDGLVSAPPRGPGEYLLGEVQSRPDDLNQQSPNFRLSQRDHLADFFERPLLGGFAAARITLRKANAIIDSVMCRYQPSHERTSYSSSPVSCLPASKHTSMAQR